MNTPSTTDKPRRWVQFGLRTLLFIVLCLCGMLAGYRAGFYQGAETKRRQSIYPKTYQVADLAELVTTPSGDVESWTSLIQIITKTVEPDSWDIVGGPGSIQEFPPSKSLVINQTGENHDRIEALFAELRQGKRLGAAKTNSP